MVSIFSDMVEKFMEVFMDDLSIFGNSFDDCLNQLKLVLARCVEKGLVLNWEMCHFMVTSGIMLGVDTGGKTDLLPSKRLGLFFFFFLDPDPHLASVCVIFISFPFRDMSYVCVWGGGGGGGTRVCM
jgi:hypothetical protein